MLPGPPDQTEKVVRVGRDSDRLRKDSINTRAFGVERAAVEVEVEGSPEGALKGA